MNKEEISIEIVKYLENQESPMTEGDILKELEINKNKLRASLKELVLSKKISSDNCSETEYYFMEEQYSAEELDNMNSVNLKKYIKILHRTNVMEKNVSKLEERIDSIYANFISLISIFVAVFSFVIINANLIFKITNENLDSFVCRILFVNLSVCVCLTVFVFVIRCIVLKPLLKQNRK